MVDSIFCGCSQSGQYPIVPLSQCNDYVEPDGLTAKQLNFVPLGLTDLAALHERIAVECI